MIDEISSEVNASNQHHHMSQQLVTAISAKEQNVLNDLWILRTGYKLF